MFLPRADEAEVEDERLANAERVMDAAEAAADDPLTSGDVGGVSVAGR